jgi:hypothetical protein
MGQGGDLYYCIFHVHLALVVLAHDLEVVPQLLHLQPCACSARSVRWLGG